MTAVEIELFAGPLDGKLLTINADPLAMPRTIELAQPLAVSASWAETESPEPLPFHKLRYRLVPNERAARGMSTCTLWRYQHDGG